MPDISDRQACAELPHDEQSLSPSAKADERKEISRS
jgi:hypothetical protein